LQACERLKLTLNRQIFFLSHAQETCKVKQILSNAITFLPGSEGLKLTLNRHIFPLSNALETFKIKQILSNAITCLQGSEGLKLALVHHLDMPIMRQKGFHIAPGGRHGT
jgi:hypothetical protein